MNSIIQLPFDKEDIKKLRKDKQSQFNKFAFSGFMSVFMFAMIILIFLRGPEPVVGIVALLAWLPIVSMAYKGYKIWSKLKTDFARGLKEVVAGEIVDKYPHYNTRWGTDLTIGGVSYIVDQKSYEKFDNGQKVLVEYAPMSKILLNIDLNIEKDPE